MAKNKEWSQEYMKGSNKRPNYELRRVGALIATAAALGGGVLGLHEALKPHKTQTHALTQVEKFAAANGLKVAREYEVKPGDSEWSIHDKSKVGGDARPFIDTLDKTLPKDSAHSNNTLQPGDNILLPENSKIGQEVPVDPSVKLPTYLAPKSDLPPPLPPAEIPDTNPPESPTSTSTNPTV